MKMLNIIIPLLIGMVSTLFANPEVISIQKKWSHKSWNMSVVSNNMVKFTTHGTSIAVGNQFGFLKKQSNCQENLLWLTIATYEKGIEDFKGKEVEIEVNIDKELFVINPVITSIYPFTKNMNIVAFSNFIASDNFIKLLKKSSAVSFEIINPRSIVQKFDIPQEIFHLDGFTANLLKSKEVCKNIKLRNNHLEQIHTLYINKDYLKAYHLALQYAESGNLYAQKYIANMYHDGVGINKNFKQAIFWYEKVANSGDIDTQYFLALNFLENQEVYNLDKAIKYMTMAAGNNHPMAQYNLSDMYKEGIGVKKDLKKSFSWIEKSAKNGLTPAEFTLGTKYYLGLGVEKDIKAAIEWFKISAKNNNIYSGPAEALLGMIYLNGKFKDYKKAYYWYSRAAKHNMFGSVSSLGMMYEKGLGIPKDQNKAFYWYEKAAKAGIKVGMFNTAVMYEKGQGVKKNKKMAFYWYEKAALEGIPRAQYNIGKAYYFGVDIDRNRTKAIHWLKSAKDNNESLAIKFWKKYNLDNF